MPGISQKRFHSTIQGPAAEALETLAAHSGRILQIWRQHLADLGVDAERVIPGGIDFANLAARLRSARYPEFCRSLQAFGGKLAQRYPRMDRAVAAANRLFESCLPFLAADESKQATPVLALARLYALVGLLVVSGYTGQWAAGKKTLVEASFAENEERQRRVSTYITRIYEEERRRLAQDLHDEVGHCLIVVKLYLEMMALEPPDTRTIQPRLAEAIKLVSHSIEAVRRLGKDLGPAVFDALGFLPAVKSYLGQFSARTGIPVTLRDAYLPADIPMSHQVALYRLMQGALSNVLQHAAARHVTISLESRKDAVLVMTIEDDGVGFDMAEAAARGAFGLSAMRERVEQLGGTIQIDSRRPGPRSRKHGTRIEVDLPLLRGDAA